MTTTELAKAFSRHKFDLTYPYLLDTIHWNVVGSQHIEGKQNVIDACQQSAAYLAGVTTTFHKFVLITTDNYVVIDSTAEYVDSEQNSTTVASCDIYEFSSGKLAAITSYTIQVNE
ncbi:hypothetical protein GCM10028805_39450 [Spirosoma harenae]